MADDEPATIEQIAEYESQLAGIVDLLKESPGDESLLALKRDMEELLMLSRANLATDTTAAAASNASEHDEQSKMPASEDLELPPPPLPPPPPPLPETNAGNPGSTATDYAAVGLQKTENTGGDAATATASKKEKPHKVKKSKKQKKVKDFVLPDHLIPNDEDTEAERNKKRRAAKSLKSKWRIQKKEIESNNRQKSWQSFQKKSSSSSTSIFATKEGLNDRVGVVSKKQLTEFGARKRHK